MDAYFDALEEEEEEQQQQQQQEQEQQRDKGERMIASRNSTAATPQSKDGPTPDSALLTKIHVPSQVRAGSGRDNSSAATNICALNAWHDHTIVVWGYCAKACGGLHSAAVLLCHWALSLPPALPQDELSELYLPPAMKLSLHTLAPLLDEAAALSARLDSLGI
jgi:hypothetical protein